MLTVQTFNRDGWPENSPIQLSDRAAPYWLQAIHDYRRETGRGDGEIIAPVGGARTAAEVVEMQRGFDLHQRGAAGWQAIYAKYNMLASSTARPSSTSPHLTGDCADAAGATFLAWMVKNGARYGWRRTLVAEGDYPHFQFFPGTATAALDSHPIGADVPLSADDLYAIWTYPLSALNADGSVSSIQARATDWLTAAANEQTAISRDNAILAAVRAIPGGGGAAPADYFSDADAAALQAAIIDKITSGDAVILQALSQVDENTLATFGLQRI